MIRNTSFSTTHFPCYPADPFEGSSCDCVVGRVAAEALDSFRHCSHRDEVLPGRLLAVEPMKELPWHKPPQEPLYMQVEDPSTLGLLQDSCLQYHAQNHPVLAGMIHSHSFLDALFENARSLLVLPSADPLYLHRWELHLISVEQQADTPLLSSTKIEVDNGEGAPHVRGMLLQRGHRLLPAELAPAGKTFVNLLGLPEIFEPSYVVPHSGMAHFDRAYSLLEHLAESHPQLEHELEAYGSISRMSCTILLREEHLDRTIYRAILSFLPKRQEELHPAFWPLLEEMQSITGAQKSAQIGWELTLTDWKEFGWTTECTLPVITLSLHQHKSSPAYQAHFQREIQLAKQLGEQGLAPLLIYAGGIDSREEVCRAEFAAIMARGSMEVLSFINNTNHSLQTRYQVACQLCAKLVALHEGHVGESMTCLTRRLPSYHGDLKGENSIVILGIGEKGNELVPLSTSLIDLGTNQTLEGWHRECEALSEKLDLLQPSLYDQNALQLLQNEVGKIAAQLRGTPGYQAPELRALHRLARCAGDSTKRGPWKHAFEDCRDLAKAMQKNPDPRTGDAFSLGILLVLLLDASRVAEVHSYIREQKKENPHIEEDGAVICSLWEEAICKSLAEERSGSDALYAQALGNTAYRLLRAQPHQRLSADEALDMLHSVQASLQGL